MQVDVARLTILSCLGGFWADLKMVALRPFLEPLVDQRLVLAEHFVNSGWQPGIPCSAFLGGEPGHFFFDEALNQARERIDSRWPKTLEVAGPNALFRVTKKMVNESTIGDKFVLLPQSETWDKLFKVGSGSYNQKDSHLHWSVREKQESPYWEKPQKDPFSEATKRNYSMPMSSDAFDSLMGNLISNLKPGRVCDIGPGAGKYGKMARDISNAFNFPIKTTGIEIDESYVEEYLLRDIYDEIVIGDANELITKPKTRFDLVIIGDCIEHMRKSDAIDLLNFLVYRVGYIVVIWPDEAVQDDWEGHAAEAHISTWSKNDFISWKHYHTSRFHSYGKMNLVVVKGLQDVKFSISDASLKEWLHAPLNLVTPPDRRSTIEKLEEQFGKDKSNSQVASRLVYALMEVGRFADARDRLADAINPQSPDGALVLALSHAYHRLGMKIEALNEAKKAVSIMPQNYHTQMHLGYLCFGSNDFELAEVAFFTAHSLSPTDSKSASMLSSTYEKLRKFHEALEAINAAIALDNGNPAFVHQQERLLKIVNA